MSSDTPILSIEAAIVSRLQEKLPELKTVGFPDDPKKYTWTSPTGEVFVCFIGADFSKPMELEQPVQIEEDEFLLYLQFRGLRDHTGAYPFLERIRLALTGYKIPSQPSSCLPLIPGKIKFKNQNKGIWTYGFTFKLKRKVVYDLEVND